MKHQTEAQRGLSAIPVPVSLVVIALSISMLSLAFSGYLYVNRNASIAAYVENHKSELKGEKGDIGPMGPQGPQGQTGAAGATGAAGRSASTSSYCNTQYYSYLNSSSTTCF